MQGDIFKIVRIQNLEHRHYDQKVVNGKQFWGSEKNLLTYEETCQPTGGAQFGNGLLGAFLDAYNNHGDVKITPDDIWIAIMIYFSKYVTDNAEQLRAAFVQHEGKKKLSVTTWNELSQSQWDEFFTLMIAEIKKNTTQGVSEKLQSDFSTTGRLQKILSTATIMNTFQKYFTYGRCIPMCGIQNIHFGGTLQDWKKLLKKTISLKQYDCNGGLKKYIDRVSIILQKFIDTYQEKVDVEFWNKIINKQRGRIGSGSTTYFNGWLIQLFGYFQKTQQVKMQSIGFDIEIDNKLTGIKKTVKLVGGFKGVSKEGQIVRPHLSFAIVDPTLQANKEWDC